MALELLDIEAGRIDGEMVLAPSGTDYVAGMACRITTTGLNVAVDAFDVIGLFKNDKSVDASTRVGPMAGDTPDQSDLRAARAKGKIKVKMTAGTLLAGTTTTPFTYPGSGGGGWAVNDKMYLQDDGKWDNVAENATDQSFGIVTKAPASAADSLEAEMDTLSAQSQSNA